jgi:hypothetical protein
MSSFIELDFDEVILVENLLVLGDYILIPMSP